MSQHAELNNHGQIRDVKQYLHKKERYNGGTSKKCDQIHKFMEKYFMDPKANKAIIDERMNIIGHLIFDNEESKKRLSVKRIKKEIINILRKKTVENKKNWPAVNRIFKDFKRLNKQLMTRMARGGRGRGHIVDSTESAHLTEDQCGNERENERVSRHYDAREQSASYHSHYRDRKDTKHHYKSRRDRYIRSCSESSGNERERSRSRSYNRSRRDERITENRRHQSHHNRSRRHGRDTDDCRHHNRTRRDGRDTENRRHHYRSISQRDRDRNMNRNRRTERDRSIDRNRNARDRYRYEY